MRNIRADSDRLLGLKFQNIFHPHSAPMDPGLSEDDNPDQMDVDAPYTTLTQQAVPSQMHDDPDEFLPMDWEDWTAAHNLVQRNEEQFTLPRIDSENDFISGVFIHQSVLLIN